MIISCPQCKTRYKLNITSLTKESYSVTCKKCSYVININLVDENRSGKNIKIVIAHDDIRVVNIIKKIIEKLDFLIFSSCNGGEAYQLIKKEKPNIAIIDVALPGMFGFELCEKIKNNSDLKDTKIILVASIYDRTRYKRKPQSLYGADDYIEKHHIPDELLSKIMALISKPLKIDKPLEIDKEIIKKEVLKDNRDILLESNKIDKIIDVKRETIRQAEQNYIKKENNINDRARKLARLIVSDIALYNQELIKKVNINNYKELLRLDVDDGINHLKRRIPEVAQKAADYIHNAFIELLKKGKTL